MPLPSYLGMSMASPVTGSVRFSARGMVSIAVNATTPKATSTSHHIF